MSFLRRLNKFIFPFLFAASMAVTSLYIATCECQGIGQPFNAWFFPAFHHWPYTFWWTYHRITWLAGPYSLLWWGLNSPALFGYDVFFLYLLSLNFLLTLVMFRKVSVFWASLWTVFAVWWTTLDPVDFFPMMFIFLGRWKWPFLLLAILTKLPVGAPFGVWQWTFTSGNSFNGPENWFRYAMLGGFWLLSLAFRVLASHPIHVRLAGNEPSRIDRTVEDG